jgi:hypothetical protein
MTGLRAVDEVEVLVLLDNVSDNLSSIPAGARHEREFLQLRGMTTRVGECLCCAAWGLSLLLTLRRGDERHAPLFDAGQFGLARIVPAHCTGWRAVMALGLAFATRSWCPPPLAGATHSEPQDQPSSPASEASSPTLMGFTGGRMRK